MEPSWQPLETESPRRSKFTAPLSSPRPQGSTKPQLPGVVLGTKEGGGLWASLQWLSAWLEGSASGL